MKKIVTALALLFIFILAACSKKSSPGKTEKIKITTYTADVFPLIQMKCTPCHLPSKGGNKRSYETYASAKLFGADMAARIQRNPGERGFMPFKNAKLSDTEIAVFKKWLSDGLPE